MAAFSAAACGAAAEGGILQRGSSARGSVGIEPHLQGIDVRDPVPVAVVVLPGGRGESPGERALVEGNEAARDEVVIEVPGEAGRYRFSHALMQRYLYRELGASRRAALHGRVAVALQRRARAGRSPT